jgi:hypothetical protein
MVNRLAQYGDICVQRLTATSTLFHARALNKVADVRSLRLPCFVHSYGNLDLVYLEPFVGDVNSMSSCVFDQAGSFG